MLTAHIHTCAHQCTCVHAAQHCSNALSSGLFYELCGKAVCQNHSFRQAEICGGSTRQKTLIVPPSTKESETLLSPKLNLKNASSVSQAPAHSLKGTADTFSQASVSASTKPEATVSVVLEEELTEDSTKSKPPLLSSAALDSPSSTKKSLGLAASDQEGQEDEKPARKLSVSRAESVSMRSDETPTRKANSDLVALSTEAPTISVYLATANFLLDVGALKVHTYVQYVCVCIYVRTYCWRSLAAALAPVGSCFYHDLQCVCTFILVCTVCTVRTYVRNNASTCTTLHVSLAVIW